MNILATSLPDIKKIAVGRLPHLLRHLSQRHEVTVLCVNAWWLEESKDQYLIECLKSIKLSYLTKKKINPILQELSAMKKFKELTRFDVHVNFNSLIAGYLVSRHKEIPTVFDICDDLPQRIRISTSMPFLLRYPGRTVGKFMLKRNINLAQRITYVTKSLSDSYHFPQLKSRIIPNGVDIQLFNNRFSQVLRQKLGIGNAFVIGFVGVLSGWVELKPALAAIRQVCEREPEVKMMIVGGGEKFQKIKDLVYQFGISNEVILTGHVPYNQVPEYISCMDCCLISLKPTADCQNAFPLTLLEYMACGKPVIATALAGVKEAVGETVLYASNAEEIKRSILTLYHNEELRKKLGRDGRILVEQNYSWQKIGQQFEEVILEVVKSKKRRS